MSRTVAFAAVEAAARIDGISITDAIAKLKKAGITVEKPQSGMDQLLSNLKAGNLVDPKPAKQKREVGDFKVVNPEARGKLAALKAAGSPKGTFAKFFWKTQAAESQGVMAEAARKFFKNNPSATKCWVVSKG